nr:alcohol dehydrogenase, C-terminal [Tanacetum cinerariifolium]
MKFAATKDIDHLRSFLSGRQHDNPQETIQALDIVLRDAASLNERIIVGSSIFSTAFKMGPLGNGVDYCKGFYQSLRPTQMGLSLNLGQIESGLILETLPQPDPIGIRLSGSGCIQVSAIDHEEIQDEDTSPSETKCEIPMEVKEMQSMIDNMVWVLVDLPPNCKIVGNKWIFKKKTNMDGIVHTYKAHLVAKGYTQLFGVNYEETFSPVADIRAIRILISIVAFYNHEIWKMVVKTAFLNGYLDEDIYMVQPEGFVDPNHPRKSLQAEEHNTDDLFFCTIHDEMPQYRCRIPELLEKRVKGCFYGWLILSSNPINNKWSLWNPLTSKIIRLPTLILKDGQYESIGQCCLSAPPDDPTLILLLTRTNKSTFVFCLLDNKRKKFRWTEMSYDTQLKRLVFNGQLFHSLTSCNAKVYALSIVSCFTTFVIHVDIVVKDKEVLIKLMLFSTCPLSSSRCGGLKKIHNLKGSSTERFYINIDFDEKIKRTENT